jgi:hypothetical protein
MTLGKVTNGDWNRPHEWPKNKWAPTPLDDLCGLLYSPFVTLFSIVWLVLSRSFQRYWWCRNQNFNVLLGSSFFFFLSYLFSQITRRERENKERKKNKSQRHTETPMTIHLWTAHVTHSCHCWWPSLVSLDLFYLDFFNGTGSVIIRILQYLQDFLLSFFPFLSLLSFCWILSLAILQFERVHRWHLSLTNCKYYLRLSKLYYFYKYYLHCYFIIILLLC